jgi:thiol:disulfide interchange protein DsbD
MMALLAILAAGAVSRFHGDAVLVSSMRTVCPGSSFEVGVKIDLDPGWHTYWRNPGDTGVSPTIAWHLPTGWRAGEVQWPIPHKLFAPELVSYGYEKQALLLVRLTAPKDAKIGSMAAVGAKVEWLVCREGCVPAKANVSIPIKIGKEARPDPVWMPRIERAAGKLPAASKDGDFSASWSGKNIVLSFDHSVGKKYSSATFYAADAVVEPSAPEVLGSSGDHPTLTLKLSQFAPASVPRLRGLLVSRQGSTTSSLTIDIPIRRTNL